MTYFYYYYLTATDTDWSSICTILILTSTLLLWNQVLTLTSTTNVFSLYQNLRNCISFLNSSPLNRNRRFTKHAAVQLISSSCTCILLVPLFLRSLKRFSMSPNTLSKFYRCTMERIFIGFIDNSNAQECRTLPYVINNVIPLQVWTSLP